MKLACICFTLEGLKLAKRLREQLKTDPLHAEDETSWYCKGKCFDDLDAGEMIPLKQTIGEWTGEMFPDHDALIFIGATGITIRAIAPYVKDKRRDPAVISLDEKGTFCIPLLSGHIGGGNELAQDISRLLGSTPVITTATDVNHRFAVDVFATKQELSISSMLHAKEVSAELLEGKQIGFVSRFPVDGGLPEGLTEQMEPQPDLGICITPYEDDKPFSRTLQLIPKTLVLGIGCRRDTPIERIQTLVEQVLKEHHLHRNAVKCIASIDLKKDEEGLKAFAKQMHVPFVTYTGEELQAVPGEFTPSTFVKQITGVDNVCERSALKAVGDGTLIIHKTSGDGVTCAVALENRRIRI